MCKFSQRDTIPKYSTNPVCGSNVFASDSFVYVAKMQ